MNILFPAENVSIKPIVATRSFPMYVARHYNFSYLYLSVFP